MFSKKLLLSAVILGVVSTGAFAKKVKAQAFERDLATYAPGRVIIDLRGQSPAEGGGQTAPSTDIQPELPSQNMVFTKGNKLFTGFDPYNSTETKFGGSAYRTGIYGTSPAPVVWGLNARGGRGPMMPALDRLAKMMPGTQGFILAVNSRGGTSLSEMMPSAPLKLWAAAEDRLAILEAAGATIGVLVYDGMQADGATQAEAEAVCANFLDYVDSYRFLHGNVPVVWFKLGIINDPPYAYQATVRQQQECIEDNLENAIALEGRGYDTTDGVHPTIDAQRTRGQAIANAIWMLWNSDSTILNTPPN